MCKLINSLLSVTINAALNQPYGVIKGTDFNYYNDPSRATRDAADDAKY